MFTLTVLRSFIPGMANPLGFILCRTRWSPFSSLWWPLTAFFTSSSSRLSITLWTGPLALFPRWIPVSLLVFGSGYRTLLVVQMVIQLFSWLFHPMSCAPQLVHCYLSFLRTLPLLTLALACLVSLPTFTHRFCSLIRTFFADLPHLQSSPMSSCPRFCSSSQIPECE